MLKANRDVGLDAAEDWMQKLGQSFSVNLQGCGTLHALLRGDASCGMGFRFTGENMRELSQQLEVR